MLRHPEYIVLSAIVLVMALYPLPWHLRTRNIATLSMIFWMVSLNTVHLINAAIWHDNTEVVGSVWGDISTAIIVGYNYGLPLAHFVLAKQLESYTSLRPSSPLYDQNAKRRHRTFDLIVTFGGPIMGILLHLTVMDRRFYIVERFGPMPATYWSTWGVILMAITPIIIAGICATYTVMALVNIHLRRQQMLSMIASDASVNRDQFYRLLFLTLAELGTCGLRAIFNLMSYQNGPQPLGHRGAPINNLTIIEQVAWDQIKSSGHLVLHLSFFTVVACSIVFFFCFATATETKKFYMALTRRIFPCVQEDTQGTRGHKLGSIDTGASRGFGTSGISSKAGESTFEYEAPPRTPRTPRSPLSPGYSETKNDISLEDMLHDGPVQNVLGKHAKWGANWAIREEEEEDGVYLAPYPTEGKTDKV